MTAAVRALEAEVEEVEHKRTLYLARKNLALSELRHAEQLLDEVAQRKMDLTRAIFKLKAAE